MTPQSGPSRELGSNSQDNRYEPLTVHTSTTGGAARKGWIQELLVPGEIFERLCLGVGELPRGDDRLVVRLHQCRVPEPFRPRRFEGCEHLVHGCLDVGEAFGLDLALDHENLHLAHLHVVGWLNDCNQDRSRWSWL